MGWSEDKVERLIDRYVKRDEFFAITFVGSNRSATKKAKPVAKLRYETMLSIGAGDGNRTHDIQLGKLTFYL